eukprot:TRINITY_DN105987_c0_g1_i1.p1 TRINITY_DN105987_c0_g1~~TRINITY_DN105987_c0_g1_i1.p1  ORF type:complete len:556 (-),score=30.19 TRINITY_DN105987_c0_g1_i1:43-1710(-)
MSDGSEASPTSESRITNITPTESDCSAEDAFSDLSDDGADNHSYTSETSETPVSPIYTTTTSSLTPSPIFTRLPHPEILSHIQASLSHKEMDGSRASNTNFVRQSDLEAKLEAGLAVNATLKHQLNAEKKQCAALKTELLLAKQDSLQVHKERQRLVTEVDRLRAELEAAAVKMQQAQVSLQQQKTSGDMQRWHQDTSMHCLEAENEKLKEDSRIATQRIWELEAQVAQYRAKLEPLLLDKTRLEQEMEATRSLRDVALRENQELLHHIRAADDDKHQTLTDVYSQLQSLQSDHEVVQQKWSKAAKEKFQFVEQIQHLQTVNDKLTKEAALHANELASYQQCNERVVSLTEQVASLSVKLEAAESRNSERKAFEDKNKKLAEQIAELECINKNLLKDKRDQHSAGQQSLVGDGDRVRWLVSTCHDLMSAHNDVTAATNQTQLSLSHLVRQITALKSSDKRMQELIVHLIQQNNHLKNEAAILRTKSEGDHNKLSDSLQLLKLENSSLKSLLDTANSALAKRRESAVPKKGDGHGIPSAQNGRRTTLSGRQQTKVP